MIKAEIAACQNAIPKAEPPAPVAILASEKLNPQQLPIKTKINQGVYCTIVMLNKRAIIKFSEPHAAFLR